MRSSSKLSYSESFFLKTNDIALKLISAFFSVFDTFGNGVFGGGSGLIYNYVIYNFGG